MTMGIWWLIFIAIISITYVQCKPVSKTFLTLQEQAEQGEEEDGFYRAIRQLENSDEYKVLPHLEDPLVETYTVQVELSILQSDEQTEEPKTSNLEGENETKEAQNELPKNTESEKHNATSSEEGPDFINPTRSHWDMWSEDYSLMVKKILPSMDNLWKAQKQTDEKVEKILELQKSSEEMNETMMIMLEMLIDEIIEIENATATSMKILKKLRGLEKLTAARVDEALDLLNGIVSITEQHSKKLKNSRKREREMVDLLHETKEHMEELKQQKDEVNLSERGRTRTLGLILKHVNLWSDLQDEKRQL